MQKFTRVYTASILSILVALFIMTPSTSAQFNSPETPEADYVPNEIIVKYVKELSPQSLQVEVDKRAEKKTSFIGSIGLFIENIGYRLRSTELPETQLARLQAADDSTGALNKTRIFDADDENQRNLFVIETDGSKTVEEMIQIYEGLPEVEYAEPNYLFSTTGVDLDL